MPYLKTCLTKSSLIFNAACNLDLVQLLFTAIQGSGNGKNFQHRTTNGSNPVLLEIAVTQRFPQNSEVNFWLKSLILSSLPK